MRVAAVVACRNDSSRLYAKPLQRVGPKPILEHSLDGLRRIPGLDEIVLAVSEGVENAVYLELAAHLGVRAISGSREDVLLRLIQGGRAAGATHVLRATSDNPFIYWEGGAGLIERVREEGLDFAVHKALPLGSFYEVFTLDALERSHREGNSRHRSELCSLYVNEHPERFRTAEVAVAPGLRRPDIRLTVDWPEDLMVVRAVYEALAPFSDGPLRIGSIIQWLDRNPEIRQLNTELKSSRIWN